MNSKTCISKVVKIEEKKENIQNDHQIISLYRKMNQGVTGKWIPNNHPRNSNLTKRKVSQLHLHLISFNRNIFKNPLLVPIWPWISNIQFHATNRPQKLCTINISSIFSHMPWPKLGTTLSQLHTGYKDSM